MLQKVGLVDEARRLMAPIVGLFHSGTPLSLDHEGIEKIASYARKHPGLLVLIDSYARCVGKLGLKERDEEIAEPLADLQEALSPYGATIVVTQTRALATREQQWPPVDPRLFLPLVRRSSTSNAWKIQKEDSSRGSLESASFARKDVVVLQKSYCWKWKKASGAVRGAQRNSSWNKSGSRPSPPSLSARASPLSTWKRCGRKPLRACLLTSSRP
jgi:hypothetical protein